MRDNCTSHLGPQKFDRVGRGVQGRSKSAPEWPEFGFGAVQRPPNWSMTPEMGPKWFPQLSVIDLSPFPDLLKHCSHYILKKYQFSYIVKIIDFWNFNFTWLSWPTIQLFRHFSACVDFSRTILYYESEVMNDCGLPPPWPVSCVVWPKCWVDTVIMPP